MNAIAKHPQLEDLPRTPASDVKKLGWRGVMEAVHREGKVVVTNHNRPEAVILPAAEYERLLQLLHEAGKAERDVLAQLGDKYRKRLEVLQTPQARDTLRDVLRTPLQLHGKVSAGDY